MKPLKCLLSDVLCVRINTKSNYGINNFEMFPIFIFYFFFMCGDFGNK